MSSGPAMHPDHETLAALAAGTIDPVSRAAALAHVDACNECTAALASATAYLRDEAQPAPNRSRWWLAVAAAAVIAIVAIPLMLRRNDSGMVRLVALAPRTSRTIEPRLSGGFAWAPYNGPMRSTVTEDDTARLKLAGAAGDLIDRAQHDHSADAQRAAATALMLIGRSSDAIDRLQAVAQASPDDVRAWNDLAAARYAAAVQLRRPSLLPEALAAVDRALRVQPSAPEPLFNRALILERMGLTGEARAAWQRCLAVDSSSPWANEARQHLAHRDARSRAFPKELPQLERAALAGDEATVRRIVAEFPQQSRAWAEAEDLGLWGDAVHRGDDEDASRRLAVARAVAAALQKTNGESLLRDAVDATDHAAGVLAKAHRVYRAGRLAYAKHQLADGERSLRDAATQFAVVGSPMAFAARYYAASARYDRGEIAAACGEQTKLLAELESHPRFAAMRAQVPWALALCSMNDADWSGALPFLERAESGFRALGEQSNLGFILMLKASTDTYAGRPDDAWDARVRAFEALSAGGPAQQLAVSLGAAARSEIREGRYDAARAMLQLEANAGREISFDAMLVDALVRQAVLGSATGDDDAAAAATRDADAVAHRIADPSLRARAMADVSFAGGAAALRRDPARARRLLTSAIDAYRARELPVLLPEAFLLRARASMATRDDADAMRDLADGIAAIETHRVDFAGGVAGTGVLDAGAALFDEAIRLALERGDVDAAFGFAERARTQLGAAAIVSSDALRERLAGTGVAVVELVALTRELVAFTVTADRVAVARTPIAREALDRLVAAGDVAALGDVLIAPHALGRSSRLIIVPDAHLAGVPFPALLDARTKQPLVARMPVSIALSATSLQRANPHVPQSIVAVALPSDADVHAAALPDVDSELHDLRHAYRRANVLAPPTFRAFAEAATRADVIHIAGHTTREPGSGDPALLFADERVSWKTISSVALPARPTVVLAACETLRAPRDPQARALSLGGGFIAAGASSVIGTLTPIADRNSRDLFSAVHQRLAAGTDAADALRDVQLAAAARGDVAWQSIAVLTRTIPTERTGGRTWESSRSGSSESARIWSAWWTAFRIASC